VYRSRELRAEYERLKKECFEVECEQNKARQLFMTVKRDVSVLNKLRDNSASFSSYQAQLVSSSSSHYTTFDLPNVWPNVSS